MTCFARRRWMMCPALLGALGCGPPPPPCVSLQPLPAVTCPEGMVGVPGGSYWMSHDRGLAGVEDFCLDRSEVTVDRYLACVESGACSSRGLDAVSPDGRSPILGPRCNAGKADRGNHPINCVDWEQAVTFCNAQQGRLPTEAEWEWAARDGACATDYPWGKNGYDSSRSSPRFCQASDDVRGTCAVGSFPGGDSPLGIHDLAGNVWEWTSSAFDPRERVIRGGSWATSSGTQIRYGYAPAVRDDDLGFRCARRAR